MGGSMFERMDTILTIAAVLGVIAVVLTSTGMIVLGILNY